MSSNQISNFQEKVKLMKTNLTKNICFNAPKKKQWKHRLDMRKKHQHKRGNLLKKYQFSPQKQLKLKQQNYYSSNDSSIIHKKNQLIKKRGLQDFIDPLIRQIMAKPEQIRNCKSTQFLKQYKDNVINRMKNFSEIEKKEVMQNQLLSNDCRIENNNISQFEQQKNNIQKIYVNNYNIHRFIKQKNTTKQQNREYILEHQQKENTKPHSLFKNKFIILDIQKLNKSRNNSSHSIQINNNNKSLDQKENKIKNSQLKNQTDLQQPKINSSEEKNKSKSLIQTLLNKTHIRINDFKLGKKLGAGKFGEVILAQSRFNNTLYAIKKVYKNTICEYEMKEQFSEQIKLNMFLNHTNIIKMYNFFDDQYHVFLIMEYANEGTLYQKLQKNKKLDQKQTSNYIYSILTALKYIHQQNIIHRDIKPQNILLVNVYMFNQNKAKICDFGWASRFSKAKGICGTLNYASPEVLTDKQYDSNSDLWSIGVLTYELLVGELPFSSKNITQIVKKIKKRKINWPQELKESTKDFIEKLLKQKDERIKMDQALMHSFLRKTL